MPQARGRTVLVVEDEVIVAHDLRQRLIEMGYAASFVASSAEEAMARAAEKRPDVAVVDIGIEGPLDGIQTAALLQERYRVPIIFLTGHPDDATLERALRTRPISYLQKPVRHRDLHSAIEIALDKRPPRSREPGRPAARKEPAPARGVPREPAMPGVRAARRQIVRILSSPDFDAPRRSREFLVFVVDETLAGRGPAISQSAIATQVFGRSDGFDPVVDPIVRIQAGRLRRSLERYYLLSGKDDAVRIELPKGTYAPAFHAVAGDIAGARPREDAASPVEPVDGWPFVVVAPFEAAERGGEALELAARLTEEMAAELGGYEVVRVSLSHDLQRLGTAQRDRVRFALSGRLRREEEGWRVTAHLVDRATGEQVWADEYHTASKGGRWSGSPEDIARVIAARIGAEEGVVVQLLATEHRRRPLAGEPTPYEAILSSYDFSLARTSQTLTRATEGLRRVLAVQPTCGLAWTRLARVLTADHVFELTPVPPSIDEAIACGQTGVRLNPASRRARCVLAVSLVVKGELAAAHDEAEESLRLRPDSLVYLDMIGWLLILCGDWERGAAIADSALQRNPHCLPHVQHGLWIDHVRRGDFEGAYRIALEYRDPVVFWRALMRACSLGHLGRREEAARELAELRRVKPDFETKGRVLIGRFIKFEDVGTRVVDGLSKAGLTLA